LNEVSWGFVGIGIDVALVLYVCACVAVVVDLKALGRLLHISFLSFEWQR